MVYLKNDCIIWLVYAVIFSNCILSNNANYKEEHNSTEAILTDTGGKYGIDEPFFHVTELAVEKMLAPEPAKLRVKKQSGGGKYTDAAKLPQVKVLRLFLQVLKNLWAPEYVGGAHPYHHEVPKPLVRLYKDKIVPFFFPYIEEKAKKT